MYLYDDHPWVPYDGSHVGVRAIGFLGKTGSLKRLVQQLARTSNETLFDLTAKVALARPFYTYEGLLEQMELFFGDPLGPKGGYLRCAKIPSEMASVLDINLR